MHCETLSFMMSYLAMFLGNRICMSRRVGQGEVGGCTQMVQTAWLCLGSAMKCPWLEPSRQFLLFQENSPLTLHSSFKGRFLC